MQQKGNAPPAASAYRHKHKSGYTQGALTSRNRAHRKTMRGIAELYFPNTSASHVPSFTCTERRLTEHLPVKPVRSEGQNIR